jgi:Uma2 family endonuclease
MDNLAYNLDFEKREELINGKIVMMASPVTNHAVIVGNIHRIFSTYLRGRICKSYPGGIDVNLTPKDRFVPDVLIVCRKNKDVLKKNAVYGAPDLIVEVLSPSTAKFDKGYKKNLYEMCGVSEYWIVDPVSCSIDVYILVDGKYELDNVYRMLPDYEIEAMENAKKEVIYEFKVSLEGFEDLTVNIAEIFEDMI